MSTEQIVKEYNAIPTLRMFHEALADFRCAVGPVGSGKTSAASWEVGYYLPFWLYETYGIQKTRWAVVRNTYIELRDTTKKTVFDWFPFGIEHKQENTYLLKYPDQGIESELLFRACDNPNHVKKFKSLDITGYWQDESIEIAEQIKRMLKNRIGRYPKFEDWVTAMLTKQEWKEYTRESLTRLMQENPDQFHTRFGIETTNPPDVEHPTYYQFKWHSPPPGPMPTKEPLAKHYGFWQPPEENNDNLRPGYYDDLRNDYRDNPDWIEMYIEGKPGIQIRGKLVYNNFKRNLHVLEDEPLLYDGLPLLVGWDHSGNMPAAVVVQVVGPLQVQILAEYYTEKMGIVDFGHYVNQEMNMMFPGHKEVHHWGDPAGAAKFSKKEGGFTSNSQLIKDNCGIDIQSSEQNFQARIESVDQMLARHNGILIDFRCIRLINGFLGGYCYPENRSIVGEFLPNVLKNKYSHPQDALQYVMVKLFKPQKRPDLVPGYKRQNTEKYDPLKFGLS